MKHLICYNLTTNTSEGIVQGFKYLDSSVSVEPNDPVYEDLVDELVEKIEELSKIICHDHEYFEGRQSSEDLIKRGEISDVVTMILTEFPKQ